MVPEDWDSGFGRSIGVFLNGEGINGVDSRGRSITDVNFLLYFNAHDEAIKFTLPTDEYASAWDTVINTAGEGVDSGPVKRRRDTGSAGQVLGSPESPYGAGSRTGPFGIGFPRRPGRHWCRNGRGNRQHQLKPSVTHQKSGCRTTATSSGR